MKIGYQRTPINGIKEQLEFEAIMQTAIRYLTKKCNDLVLVGNDGVWVVDDLSRAPGEQGILYEPKMSQQS